MLVAYGLLSKPSVPPVKIKPLLLRRTVPNSQPVFGSAPIITKTVEISRTVHSPVFEWDQVTLCREESPSSALISDSVWTVIWLEFSIREIRYCDIVCAKDGPRTTWCTCLAIPERNSDACPAELPPPTTTTSRSRHNADSIAVAA